MTVLHLKDVRIQSGLGPSSASPIKRDMLRDKHEAQLAKATGLTQFGVNYVTLEPGAISALRHWHEEEDELVYVLSGELTLIDNDGEHKMTSGTFAGFRAGVANAHHLVNRSTETAAFIVVGTRKVGAERVHYPDEDLGPITIMRDNAGNRIA
jgi:uncharacterized cupin superfamily protein